PHADRGQPLCRGAAAPRRGVGRAGGPVALRADPGRARPAGRRQPGVTRAPETRNQSEGEPMGSVRVAIAGVGNCATSLIQGVEYYKDADPAATVPGLMHVVFGDYHVRDVEFVAAFDVDDKKVG